MKIFAGYYRRDPMVSWRRLVMLRCVIYYALSYDTHTVMTDSGYNIMIWANLSSFFFFLSARLPIVADNQPEAILFTGICFTPMNATKYHTAAAHSIQQRWRWDNSACPVPPTAVCSTFEQSIFMFCCVPVFLVRLSFPTADTGIVYTANSTVQRAEFALGCDRFWALDFSTTYAKGCYW